MNTYHMRSWEAVAFEAAKTSGEGELGGITNLPQRVSDSLTFTTAELGSFAPVRSLRGKSSTGPDRGKCAVYPPVHRNGLQGRKGRLVNVSCTSISSTRMGSVAYVLGLKKWVVSSWQRRTEQ